MRRFALIALVFAAILSLSSCSKDYLSSPNNSNKNGSVNLVFDKTSAPQNVSNIIAYLSRANFDTLKGNLNLLSTSSADIKFNDIPVGIWHLKVNAMNADSAVVYSGETDIQINDGIVTRVNLTLTPTGKGTGSIYIFVNWGNSISDWVDYQMNPIFTVQEIPYFTLAVTHSQVMFDNGIYKMWFMNLYYNGKSDISYAESNDGILWHLASNSPVLTAGQGGTWDDNSVEMGYVLKENGIYKLYFIGTKEPNSGMRQIGLATSSDGIHWQKYTVPILQSTSSQFFLGVNSVIKINDIYYMYYGASPENDYKFNICLATSTDGVNWIRFDNNPIIAPTEDWENGSIGYATIVKTENGFKMTYSNGSQNKVGMAYSTDGIHWTKEVSNPVFNLSDVANNWCSKISYPFSVQSGNDYRLYYSGLGSDSRFHLGVALWR